LAGVHRRAAPGTPFHAKARENGWLAVDDPEQFNGIDGSVLNYPNYPKAQIRETVNMMAKRFSTAARTMDTIHSEAGKKTWLPPEQRDAVRPRMKALQSAFDGGDDARALTEANALLAEYPQTLRPRFVIATVNERMGNVAAARTGFEEIISLAQDYNDAIQFAGEAHFHLGMMENRNGARPAALEHFKRCMHLCPGHPGARQQYWDLQTGNGKR